MIFSPNLNGKNIWLMLHYRDWDGKSQLTLAPEMLQLRYANYPKDYFMGMLPASQYGSVAVLPSSYVSSPPSYLVAPNPTGAASFAVNTSGPTIALSSAGSGGNYPVSLNSDL